MTNLPSKTVRSSAVKTLNISAISWFIVALFGQWIFVYYITAAYGGSAIQGEIASWSNNTIKGHAEGDGMGNFMFASHLLMAVILTLGGTLQLIPQIRNRFIKFHKINGRIFIFTAYAMSLGGLYLVWIREAILSMNGAVAITLNAILIFIFCTLAIRTARAKNIIAHQKWALRAFIVVNGVWFFRVGFMAWILIHQDALWSTENLDGPFDLFWAYANYLLPLAILELYLYAKNKPKNRIKYTAATVLFLSTLITAVGIFGAYLMMWGPSM